VHQWLKKAVLLSFRLNDNQPVHAGALTFFDKVPTKFSHIDDAAIRASGVRVVPPAVARRGSFLGKGVVLMPSYVNIGAYVDDGSYYEGEMLKVEFADLDGDGRREMVISGLVCFTDQKGDHVLRREAVVFIYALQPDRTFKQVYRNTDVRIDP
jgi:hypothetical protein